MLWLGGRQWCRRRGMLWWRLGVVVDGKGLDAGGNRLFLTPVRIGARGERLWLQMPPFGLAGTLAMV